MQKIIILLTIIFFLIAVSRVRATRSPFPSPNPSHRIHFRDHSCTQNDPSPTPTISPSPVPTASLSATPAITTAVTPQPRGEGYVPPTQSHEAPKCEAKDTTKLPINLHVYRKGDVAIVKYWPTEGDTVSVFYRQNDSKYWQYSLTEQNDGFVTIAGLGNKDISFAVMQRNTCSGGVMSHTVVDGPSKEWVLFR